MRTLDWLPFPLTAGCKFATIDGSMTPRSTYPVRIQKKGVDDLLKADLLKGMSRSEVVDLAVGTFGRILSGELLIVEPGHAEKRRGPTGVRAHPSRSS